MVIQLQKSLKSPVPVYTLIILVVSVLAYVLPGMTSVLIFDRAAILNGEVWRILSGHTVHFSGTHFAYDLLAFGLAGGLIEYKRYPNCGVLYMLTALAIGVSLLIFKPGMHYYGGLSGMACGSVVYLALFGLRDTPSVRLVSAMILVLVVSKIAFELYTGRSALMNNQLTAFISMPLSHLVGVLTAGLFYFYSEYGGIKRRTNKWIEHGLIRAGCRRCLSMDQSGSDVCIGNKS